MNPIGHRTLLAAGLTVMTVGGTAYAAQADFLNIFVPVRSVAVIAWLIGGAIFIWRSAAWTPWHHRPVRNIGIVVGTTAIVGSATVCSREFRACREVPITFEGAGTRLAGSLYLPSAAGRYPAVVIAGLHSGAAACLSRVGRHARAPQHPCTQLR